MARPELLKSLEECARKGHKKLAVLIDPNGSNITQLSSVVTSAGEQGADIFFVGGSLVFEDRLEQCLEQIRQHTTMPAILFPGNAMQVHSKADAILFLSLISGRNSEYLIGQQVAAAPLVYDSGIEVIPTGYMLIDGGRVSSTQYITQSIPIPADKIEIAVTTALAGKYLGMRSIYLDAGSGASRSVSNEMISKVKQAVQLPLIVGGGIRSATDAYEKARAGADIIVVGNVLEKDPSLIYEFVSAIKEAELAI